MFIYSLYSIIYYNLVITRSTRPFDSNMKVTHIILICWRTMVNQSINVCVNEKMCTTLQSHLSHFTFIFTICCELHNKGPNFYERYIANSGIREFDTSIKHVDVIVIRSNISPDEWACRDLNEKSKVRKNWDVWILISHSLWDWSVFTRNNLKCFGFSIFSMNACYISTVVRRVIPQGIQ